MPSIAEQSPAELGGPLSVLHRQRRDHVRLGHLLERLGDTPGRGQGPVLLAIYRLVFPHAFAEEAVLWPVIRAVLEDGHELTLRVEREHQAINELVTRLQELAPDAPERETVLVRTIELLVEDVRDEEDLLLPRLQAALTPVQLKLLGFAWEAVRRIAPTRPHPIVSRRPPGNVLSALPLSLLDRLRDRADWASFRSTSEQLTLGLRHTSAALRAASEAVERVPGMKAGEDPRTRRRPRAQRRSAATLMMAVGGAGIAVYFARRYRSLAEPAG